MSPYKSWRYLAYEKGDLLFLCSVPAQELDKFGLAPPSLLRRRFYINLYRHCVVCCTFFSWNWGYILKIHKKGQDRNKMVTDNHHNAPIGKNDLMLTYLIKGHDYGKV